jgi:hypothetical protein
MDESLRSVSVLFELQLAALRELAIGLPLGTAKRGCIARAVRSRGAPAWTPHLSRRSRFDRPRQCAAFGLRYFISNDPLDASERGESSCADSALRQIRCAAGRALLHGNQ